ncbi:MAG: ATP-dependent DNA ligase [Gammaproteobacteria bacterium]|nr:ATP-dependent DNA ligase [Gammaproteobacteria bacterium]
MKPMLACTAGPEHIQAGYLVAPKLDGIRALHVPGAGLVTRALKPIPNEFIRSVWRSVALNGLDGELIQGDPTAPDVFRRTTSAAMRRDGEPHAVFHVFDDFTDHAAPFTERLARLEARVAVLTQAGYPVALVPQTRIGPTNPLEAVETAILAEGYEGLIARNPATPYKFGRSTLREARLLKLKRFDDGEAVILRAVELQRNANAAERNALGYLERSTAQAGLVPGGMLGALEVRDMVTGVEFSIGSGFDHATRVALWTARDALPGRLVAYRHFPIGAYDRPRFPTFKGLRSRIDLAA